MKQKSLLLLAFIGLTTLLAGCSNEFEEVFGNGNKEAIAPAEVLVTDSELAHFLNDYSRLKALVISIIGESTISSDPSKNTKAVIINNTSALKDVVSPDGDEWKWPTIDFKGYSLVIGCYEVVHTNISAVNQRIVRKKDGLVLYLELKSDEGVVGYTFGEVKYFAALYPKLPDLPVEVRRWDNY